MKSKIMQALISIMTALSGVIMILNLLAGVVGGVWLLILGDWPLIVYGIAISFFMPWIFSITLFPTMGIMFLVNYFQTRKNIFLVSVFGYFGSLFTNLVIAYWVYFVYSSFMSHAELKSIIPILLVGYATMLSPLSYMARGESSDNYGTTFGILLAIVCYFALFILGLFIYPSFLHLTLIAGIFSFVTMTIVSPSIATSMNDDQNKLVDG